MNFRRYCYMNSQLHPFTVYSHTLHRVETVLLGMKKLLFLFLAAFFALASADQAYTQTKTIVLVRHAEKADGSSQDPELSAQGKERAQRLVKKINK